MSSSYSQLYAKFYYPIVELYAIQKYYYTGGPHEEESKLDV